MSLSIEVGSPISSCGKRFAKLMTASTEYEVTLSGTKNPHVL